MPDEIERERREAEEAAKGGPESPPPTPSSSSLRSDEEGAGPPEPEEEPVFEDGFSLKTVFGALFIALFMLPGGIYLGLVAGWGVGEAAEWVTIVLFAEVARRSFQPLRKQEIYILFYLASGLTSVVNRERGLGGGPFANLVWSGYFASSEAARPIADKIPSWAIPSPESAAVAQRQLWHPNWWTPILLLVVTDLCGRISWMSLGYALFRVTSDVERLPFPYAPVAASGATALAEAGSESWRWRIFSTGTVIGLLFGVVYIAVPILTGIVWGEPVELLPIPFADYTTRVENLLPAAIVGLSLSLGNILVGFVLPFEILLGAATASVLAMVVINPILYHSGLLPHYRLGSNAWLTKLAVDMDFWLSIGIGVNIAVGILGIALVLKAVSERRRFQLDSKVALAPPKGRGDIPVKLALLAWLAATMVLIVLCRILVPSFPVWILVVFGLVWTPLNSYISARMHGLTGRGISFPYLKEGAVVASGYQKVDIWFAPLPLNDYGWAAQRFREVELTRTKITSIFKAEALMFPLVMVASFGFWAFFWNSNPVPSAQFPYAQRFWPVHSGIQAVMTQVNVPQASGEASWVAQALKPDYIVYGTAGGLAAYGLFALLKLPLLFFYGFAGGIGLFPANTVPQLFGAWFGKRYMKRKYGEEQWSRYAPVLFAGFACGTGLVAMASISLALIAKAVARLPY